MKKLIIASFILCAILILSVSPVSLYASDDTLYTREDLLNTDNIVNGKAPLVKFGLSGLNETNSIKTFDNKKVFSGVADAGANITAVVYIPAGDGKWKENKSYSISVGASGVFSITIDFNLGESIVIIKAEKDGNLSAETLTVSRKEAEIRDKIKETSNLVKIRLN